MDRAPSRYDATFDFGRVYDRSHQHGLANSTDPHGDILAALQYDLALEPDERVKFTFLAGAYHDIEATAVDSYARARDERNTLQATVDYLSACLLHSQVLTPDPLINEGAMWSKVNMRRVMSIYPQGLAFTNDPGSSSNVVGRDAAWFIYGNDHFLPEFSCALLRKFGEIQYSNGKIPEFFNALDGQTEDDGLNINDDTPLFILAANHHHRSHGTVDRLADTYPAVAKYHSQLQHQRSNYRDQCRVRCGIAGGRTYGRQSAHLEGCGEIFLCSQTRAQSHGSALDES
jgi:hypothetical protein